MQECSAPIVSCGVRFSNVVSEGVKVSFFSFFYYMGALFHLVCTDVFSTSPKQTQFAIMRLINLATIWNSEYGKREGGVQGGWLVRGLWQARWAANVWFCEFLLFLLFLSSERLGFCMVMHAW